MASNSFSTDQATFIGFAVEAIAYGAYAILFSISLVVLLLKSKTEHAKLPMLFVSCYLFALCTIHFALNFHNVYNGLLVHPRPISEENTLLEAADSIVFVTDFSAQLVLIYRCWLVWGRVYTIIIIPFLMALAAFACSFGSLGLLKKIGPNLSAAPAAIIPLGTSAFAMSLCLNFIVTSLIVGRIWYISRGTKEFPWVGDSGLTKAMGVMIESGLLFLVAQFVFVVLFAIGHPAQDIAVTAALQIYGISPTLIIVRVGLGSSYEQSATRVSTMRVAHFRKRGTPAPSKNTTNTFDADVELSSHNDGAKSIGTTSGEGKATLPSPT